MIVFKGKEFQNKQELHKFIIQNKDFLISEKKSIPKQLDNSFLFNYEIENKNIATKSNENTQELLNKNELTIKAVINTSNWFDSHFDVHIGNIWTKSLKEKKILYFLKEHKYTFENIIADSINDKLKAYVEEQDFLNYGLKKSHKTNALIFDVTIKKDRNPYMFEQYAKGYVLNHSVGMQYVKIAVCIDDDDYPEEYENYKKYITFVANKKDVEEFGFFYAILEAKLIEGSAVPMGSNVMTPTQEIKEVADLITIDVEQVPTNVTLDNLKKLNNLLNF